MGMFLATTLLYPLLLATLCFGAGLLADRVAGGWLHPALLAPVGAAGLIGVSQLSTIPPWLAPATPWLIVAVALLGLALARARAGATLAAAARSPLAAMATLAAYLLALAPVLLAGRPSFSSYGTLSDSAVHMAGADYILHHGQSYSGLDLSNSYGLFIKGYYGTSYPSGADTLLGGSALLAGLPLIWAFQPFNAFVLALGCGPAWVLVRRLGLGRGWSAVAAVTAVLPALVYAYELFGSIKEITTLPLLLSCGCLAADPGPWLARRGRGAVPLALLFAAGLSALGAAFGAWAAATLIAIGPAALGLGWGGRSGLGAASRSRPQRKGRAARARPRARGLPLAALAVGAAVVVVAALPTWKDLGGSLKVAGAIASTSNPGNLHEPLRAVQVLGMWLHGSYKLPPTGAAAGLTDALIAVALAAALLGVWQCARRRAWGLGAWTVMMLVTWLAISQTVTTWASAKTLVLTSPAVMVMAWGGVALLRRLGPRALGMAGALLGLVVAGGVLASDELQYSASDMAPTARYEELAKVGERFAGRGPALFTDFDEYSLYELRRLDVGSPDFLYPSPALQSVAGGYGKPFSLQAIAPSKLVSYPLIVTRRNPAEARPPAAYRLAWAGTYYEVWQRRPGARPAQAQVMLTGSAGQRCARIERLASKAAPGESLTGSLEPELVRVALGRSSHPGGWARLHGGVVMSGPGTLRASFTVPRAGEWRLWLQGEFMPSVGVRVDGRRVGEVAGQLSGNSLVTAPAPPLTVALAAGRHVLAVTRPHPNLAPGARGSVVLHAAFLTPQAASPAGRLVSAPASSANRLCSVSLEWVALEGSPQIGDAASG